MVAVTPAEDAVHAIRQAMARAPHSAAVLVRRVMAFAAYLPVISGECNRSIAGYTDNSESRIAALIRFEQLVDIILTWLVFAQLWAVHQGLIGAAFASIKWRSHFRQCATEQLDQTIDAQFNLFDIAASSTSLTWSSDLTRFGGYAGGFVYQGTSHASLSAWISGTGNDVQCFPEVSQYTITNPATLRAFDTASVTTANLAKVVGTVIADLRGKGIFI